MYGIAFYFMLLTEKNIVHYLLDRGLFDKAPFVNGKFSCHAGNSRHKNYIVNREFETNRYFIKQALGSNSEKIASLQREGLFYEIAAANENLQPLQKYLPVLLLHDKGNAILVLEYLADYTSIYDLLLYQQDLNSSTAAEIAHALFLLHSTPAETIEKLTVTGLMAVNKPWIFTLSELKSFSANEARSEAEAAGLQLIYDVPGFIDVIDEASKLWIPDCIVHGDSKLNNFLLKTDKTETGSTSLKLIDWELFNTGDPLWDLATVLQSALTAWVINEDPVYKTNTGVKIFDQENMQFFISACITNYAAANKWDDDETRIKLKKCTAFCGLRLLHNFFETTPHAKSLRPYSARILQLAYNILSNPAEAAQQVLGIKL
jgi:aminoglycoside phosphotransferase (APT) family kinase protein